jgi:hypothetical protein
MHSKTNMALCLHDPMLGWPSSFHQINVALEQKPAQPTHQMLSGKQSHLWREHQQETVALHNTKQPKSQLILHAQSKNGLGCL